MPRQFSSEKLRNRERQHATGSRSVKTLTYQGVLAKVGIQPASLRASFQSKVGSYMGLPTFPQRPSEAEQHRLYDEHIAQKRAEQVSQQPHIPWSDESKVRMTGANPKELRAAQAKKQKQQFAQGEGEYHFGRQTFEEWATGEWGPTTEELESLERRRRAHEEAKRMVQEAKQMAQKKIKREQMAQEEAKLVQTGADLKARRGEIEDVLSRANKILTTAERRRQKQSRIGEGEEKMQPAPSLTEQLNNVRPEHHNAMRQMQGGEPYGVDGKPLPPPKTQLRRHLNFGITSDDVKRDDNVPVVVRRNIWPSGVDPAGTGTPTATQLEEAKAEPKFGDTGYKPPPPKTPVEPPPKTPAKKPATPTIELTSPRATIKDSPDKVHIGKTQGEFSTTPLELPPKKQSLEAGRRNPKTPPIPDQPEQHDVSVGFKEHGQTAPGKPTGTSDYAHDPEDAPFRVMTATGGESEESFGESEALKKEQAEQAAHAARRKEDMARLAQDQTIRYGPGKPEPSPIHAISVHARSGRKPGVERVKLQTTEEEERIAFGRQKDRERQESLADASHNRELRRELADLLKQGRDNLNRQQGARVTALENELGKIRRIADKTDPAPAPFPPRGTPLRGGVLRPGDPGYELLDPPVPVIEEHKQEMRQDGEHAGELRMGRFIDKFTAGLAQGLRGLRPSVIQAPQQQIIPSVIHTGSTEGAKKVEERAKIIIKQTVKQTVNERKRRKKSSRAGDKRSLVNKRKEYNQLKKEIKKRFSELKKQEYKTGTVSIKNLKGSERKSKLKLLKKELADKLKRLIASMPTGVKKSVSELEQLIGTIKKLKW